MVTKIQKEFLKHPDFVYFRKGEFANALDVAWAHLQLIDPLVTGYFTGVAAGLTVEILKDKVEDWRQRGASSSMSSQRDLRFIMGNRLDPEPTIAEEMLCQMGFHKRLIPPEQVGQLRYFVSSKEYFVFFRKRGDRFHGLRGDDAETRGCLSDVFLDEWESVMVAS